MTHTIKGSNESCFKVLEGMSYLQNKKKKTPRMKKTSLNLEQRNQEEKRKVKLG